MISLTIILSPIGPKTDQQPETMIN